MIILDIFLFILYIALCIVTAKTFRQVIKSHTQSKTACHIIQCLGLALDNVKGNVRIAVKLILGQTV